MKTSAEYNEIIELSKIISQNFGHQQIGTEHLLLALMGKKETAESVRNMFPEMKNISYGSLIAEVIDITQGIPNSKVHRKTSSNLKKVMSKSHIRAFSRKSDVIESEDLICALFKESDTTATKVIDNCKKRIECEVCESPQQTFDKDRLLTMRKETPTLNMFSHDLTLAAFDNRIDPVYERDTEIEQIIRVLMRKNKNNPCLIGNAGVGKTAIADGIAIRIINGDVPNELQGKRVVSLDIALLLAGARYRGDFEERLKKVFEEVKKVNNVIIFIDEIHNIVNAGNGEGTLDAANILKPELARGEISVIGATTAEEYAKTIEKDAALERRFQKISVDEPSPDMTLKILEGIKTRYEQYHKINITNDSLKKAIDISIEYLPNRFLPDKAIDIIDEAASLMKIEGKTLLLPEDIERSFKKSYRQTELSGDILCDFLNNEVLGQEEPIVEIVEMISSRRHIVSNCSPLSMVFAGSTGTGKTQLAKSISTKLFGEHSLLKLDMGEYGEKHSVSKLIGAPPGYVGYEDNGILVNAVLQNSQRVILFDEVEKAHPEVLKILLNILDDGVLRNTRGKCINFGNCIFILTTNIGGVTDIGFKASKNNSSETDIMKILGREINGRIDKTVFLNSPTVETAKKICTMLVDKCRDFCFNEKVSLEVDRDVIDRVIEMSDLQKYGYRNLKKTFLCIVEREIIKAWSVRTESLYKIRIYLNEKNEITQISYFSEIGLENKRLSMYNI